MQKLFHWLWLGGALLLGGCDKQAKINSQKIDALSEKVIHQEQIQSKQMALLQAQMAMLAPQLDKETSAYFEKNHDAALFFHTNTLFLLLTIGKQIEAQLQAADAARIAHDSQTYGFHTNELNTMYLCAAQIEEAMNGRAGQTEEKINAETKRAGAALSNALLEQIKLAAAPDAAEIARRKKLDAAVAQIQRDLETINARLANTNPPTVP